MKNLTESDKFMIFILLIIAMVGLFAYKVQTLNINQDPLQPKIKTLVLECPLAKDYFQRRVFEEAPLSTEDLNKAKAMCSKAELFVELNK